MTNKTHVMSGIRPTGRLHLGHYFGILKNWVSLQDQYDCYYSIADWHALTTKYDDTASLVDNIYEVALDILAVGVDPNKATLYVQSSVPQIAELHLLFSMFTPVKWLETDPTLKDMVAMRKEGGDVDLNYGLLGYPVLQTMDILGPRAALVPIGQDQLAHLEISRDVARRFNHIYQTDYFPEPKPLLTEIPKVLGLDGRKMGKSYNNAIFLSDTEDETFKKIKTAITDPERIKRDDPGDPAKCQVVYPFYEIFGDDAMKSAATDECRQALRGCMDCKKILAERVNEILRPIRERRATLANDRGQVLALLKQGCEKSRHIHEETVQTVRQLMHLFVDF